MFFSQFPQIKYYCYYCPPFFFLIRNIGEVEENLLTVKKVKLKMHFYGRKSHHLHQNRTRSTYKPIAIKQIFKENKNKKNLLCLGPTVLPWKLQRMPGCHFIPELLQISVATGNTILPLRSSGSLRSPSPCQMKHHWIEHCLIFGKVLCFMILISLCQIEITTGYFDDTQQMLQYLNLRNIIQELKKLFCNNICGLGNRLLLLTNELRKSIPKRLLNRFRKKTSLSI